MKFIRHLGSTDSIVIYRQANRLTDRETKTNTRQWPLSSVQVQDPRRPFGRNQKDWRKEFVRQMCVMWEALTTVRARQFWICCTQVFILLISHSMRLSVADVDVSEFALLLGYRSAQSDIATWRSLLISEAITLVAVRCISTFIGSAAPRSVQ